MRIKKYIINLFAATALLVGCNESLEDTYSDYAGDGKIHYVAKCTEVHAVPGWERLILEWINGTDATIDKIKVVWSCENLRDSTFLPNSSSSFELKNLVSGTYRFDVCAVDAAGNESLKETTYGRPYTRDHEIMLAFTRGVIKPYFLKNKMIFFSDQWNENIEEIVLEYKDTQGHTQHYTFDKKTSYNTLVTLDDVSMNPADTVYVFRKGRLEDCPDIIEFDKLAISRMKNFSAGFVNAIERRYGYSTKTKEQQVEFEKFIEGVTELEFDYDIETFEDVLYCPNLKKLVFGKNRYLSSITTEYAFAKLRGPAEKSIQVLNKANEPDVLGLTIDCYTGWDVPYFYDDPTPIEKMLDLKGVSKLPQMEIVKTEALRTYDDGNKILCSPADAYAGLENLLDDNNKTPWETTNKSFLRTYEMQMELLDITELNGIKVAQKFFYPMQDKKTQSFMPSYISVQTSVDGSIWENVTYFESNELGRGPGEITLLPFHEGARQVKYIKFSLRDGVDWDGNCMISLGDIVLYKLK